MRLPALWAESFTKTTSQLGGVARLGGLAEDTLLNDAGPWLRRW